MVHKAWTARLGEQMKGKNEAIDNAIQCTLFRYYLIKTYDSSILVIHILQIDFFLGISYYGQNKWLSIVVAVGTYTHIDLVGEFILQVCLCEKK